MAKYTGYVGSSATGRGYAYSRETGIVPVAEKPDMPRDPGAPAGDFVRAPSGKYITDFSRQPQTRGDYLEDRAWTAPDELGFQEQTSAEKRLEENYNIVQDMIRNEYLQKSQAILQLPPDSNQSIFLNARLEQEQFNKFAKADADYQSTLVKLQTISKDNTLDFQQSTLAGNEVVNGVYKFDTKLKDLQEMMGPTVTDLAGEAVKIQKVLENTPKGSPQYTVLKNQLLDMQDEIAKRKGLVYVEIKDRAGFKPGYSKGVKGYMTPSHAVKEHTDRGLDIPEELKASTDTGKVKMKSPSGEEFMVHESEVDEATSNGWEII